MINIEFFTYEEELWFRNQNETSRLTENRTDIISKLISIIETFYPTAFEALSQEYKKCNLNIPFYRFRIVTRFCKCNFANIDNIPDYDNGTFHFERVMCPLRGECKNENIICNPTFAAKITTAETRVIKLIYDGRSEAETAEELCLSIYTIKNHIRNAYTRIGVKNRVELIKYITDNNLF